MLMILVVEIIIKGIETSQFQLAQIHSIKITFLVFYLVSLQDYFVYYYQLYIIQMHNYKGQLRRDSARQHTPTKSSWDREREQYQPNKYEQPPNERQLIKNQDKYESKYETKNQQRYETKYDKSQLSYYQSQSSRVVYDYDRSQRPSAKSQTILSDEKYLFNEIMTVRVRSFERQEYEQRIRLQIQMRAEKSFSMLTILLTDDSNPRFLWMFAIRQGDFMNLKQQQKLKVSYGGFPDMLRDCFRECQNGEYHKEDKNNHLALQIRKGGQGKLSVLQSNRYKQSTHLQLQFKLANDEQLKQHLSNKYSIVSDELSKARNVISNLQNILSQRNYQFERLNAQLNEYKRDGQMKFEKLKMDQRDKLTDAESKRQSQLSKIKREFELELKELRQRTGSQIDALNKVKTDLTNKLSQAKQKILNLQSNQKQLNIKVSRLDQDVNKYLKEYETLKSENKQLSDRRFQNQKTITQLTCRIESLRSELEDKKTIITSTVQLKQTNNSQISSLEFQNNEQRKQIIKLQTKVTELQSEISKLTSTNAELLDKISRQKQKLAERGEIIKEQEKEVKDLKKNQLILTRQNEEMQYRNNDKDNKIKNLQELLENMQLKLQDQTKLVMALQKSLNERPPLRTTSNYTGNYQPTIPYSGVNREIPSQLSTNSIASTSRVTSNISNQTAKTDKYEPNIRRYQQRSKSPIPKRLTQQRQPQQEQNSKAVGFQQPRPIKFKMSQPSRQE